MKMHKKLLSAAVFSAVFLAAALLSGCGYKIGYLGHPQLKSVAIAPVVNDTIAYNISADMRGLLSECFQTDGTMKLTGMSTADCIVYARITDITFAEVSWSTRDSSSDNFTPNQWKVTLGAEYSVIIPGRAAPLLQNQKISGSAEFVSGPDIEISRNYATKQACYMAAKKIVAEITEAW